MEDVLDATFYQDDFLTRTLTSSSLYDKNHLDLTFVDNNNIPRKDHLQDNDEENPDSPNLDFLKLGSPDLEQMFMNIHEHGDELSNDDESSNVSAAAFNIEEDLVKADNCFTEALQQLHDKQDNVPVEIIEEKVKVEEVSERCLNVLEQPVKIEPTKRVSSQQSLYKSKSKQHLKRHLSHQRHSYNAIASDNSHMQNKNLHREVNALSNHPLHQNIPTMAQPHMAISEQIAMNNQMALLNSMGQSMNVHQMQQQQQQQQQQEIAFLTQAMGFQAERENIQAHLINGFPQHHTGHVLPSIQQKMLEQQIMQQQQHQQPLNGGYSTNDNPSLHGISQLDSLATLGVDEQTIKMFVENPHLAPINLEIQELIKRERKKLRNRIASSKCRKRKLEREGRLEDKVRVLKEKNIELNAVANALKQQICDLKQRVMDHVGEGCQIVLPSFMML
ncbi:putative cyclin-dependent serine/threonine-protein kinase DDB_G0272797/DDB_G0274007 [Hydractinia symbiolongicarpus]|uniref:putative cyclin-dependent serine/threonine-protein kinase DDB_G0272797/DDB_G0274007 n=1 Tax=Hydractinia symbiolongicarpus TaxID=13093 RepID=UPI00254F0DAD|nr:putative cyclin-dependent serine/threonine-protein kinase DDB_G0272797/DDB_G0274007 [Hydractinia symbiolongicarpus]